MTTPITVNQSTTLIQIDTSVLTNSPHIVLLSSLNAPGSMITIRDTTGYAGQTNTIIVSTTQGIAYLDGGGARSNIYTINQPYGFLTITPKTSNLWGVINTFAFPDASASANLNFLNVSSMNISTIGYIQQALISTASISTLCTNNVYIRDNLSVGQSTIAHAGFYVCSIRSLHDIIASSNIYAGSTLSSVMANFTSTLTVPYISTTNVWINGGLQTTSSISTSGPMFVGSSISTTGNLAVGASTFIQGQLTVLQAAFFGSSISTTGALNVGHETILHSTLQVSHESRMGASLSVMSSLYIQWDVYTTSSILTHSSFSTLHDVNIGRNLSTLGKAFIGQEVYTTSSILTTGSFSTLEDVNVARNVSVLGNLYVKGTVQFDNKAMSFQDIVASSILTQYNISSMSSLIAGGGLYVSQSTILFGTVSTMSNFNIAGLLSTASTIVAGDSLIVAKSGYFGSSISTPSSIGVGGILRVGGGVVLESTLSTFGQAAFFSSVQIQGSLSVMSSIVAACNLYVGNTLSTSNLTLYGSTSISTLAVTNTVDFGLNISSSTLHHGLFSTSGAMNIGGLISTTNALTVGSTINTQFLDVRQTMSVFSNAGFAQDISARGSVFVGMSTLVAGGFWANKSATMADTRYTGAVVMDTTLTVGNGSSQTKLNSLLGVLNTATFSNSIFITTGSTQTQNRISNDTWMQSLKVVGNVGINCNTPQYGLDVNGNLNFTGTINSNGAPLSLTPTGINTAGNVGINTISNASYSLTVNGAQSNSGTFYAASNYINAPPLYATTIAGSSRGIGVDGYSDGIGLAAQFYRPRGICIDAAGNIYVNDWLNSRIRKITPSRVVTTIAGSGSFATIDGTGAGASFNNARGICINSTGTNLYISEQNGKIRKLVISTGVVTTIPNVSYSAPLGICVDSTETYLYITENGGFRVSRLTISSGVTTEVAALTYPTDICISPSGLYLYILDDGGSSVKVVTISNGNIITLAGTTQNDYAEGTGATARFSSAEGICINSAGTNLYVSDSGNYRIRKIVIGAGTANSGVVTLVTGIGTISYSPDTPTPVNSTVINFNKCICVNRSETNLYITQDTQIVKEIGLALPLNNLYVNGTTSLNGNVGINTIASSYALDVNGDINYTGNLKINGANAVFTPAGINSAGSIGINGASNASYALNVNGATNLDGVVRFKTTVTHKSDDDKDRLTFNFNGTTFFESGDGTFNFQKLGGSSNTFIIDNDGNVTASGNVTAYSDVRAKENIVTIDSALDKVMALRGVYYTRKDTPGPRQVGVIAQEVEAVLPEVVMTDSEGKKSVAYGNIVALLLEGMKEQQGMINELKSTIMGYCI